MQKNANSIVIPKNLLLCKIQIASISNRRHSAPFNQEPCNPKAKKTGRPLCWLLSYCSQDRTLTLRFRLTLKSSNLYYLPYLPAKAISSITGSAMAFGHQYSTRMPTEADFKKEA